MDGQIVWALVFAALVGLVVWRLVPARESDKGPDPGLALVVAELQKLRKPVVVPQPRVTVRLMSEGGVRQVGAVEMERRARNPTLRIRVGGRWEIFAASHEEGGAWVYRRVGIEA